MGKKAERKDSPSSDAEAEEKGSKEDSTKVEPITEVEFKFLLQDVETTTEGLTKFIRCSEAYSDGVPCPDIVAKYLKSSPNCVEVLNLLEQSETPLKSTGIALVFKCLEQILTRIRTDLTKNLAAGETIVQKVLAGYMKPVYGSLQAQSKSNIIKAAVQLLIAMALLSEKTKKALQTRLNFNHVHFSALFRRRNRKDPQDVRSCMILLTLALLVNSDSNTVRFMVQQKTFLQVTIAGLKFDSKDVVVDVLLTFLDKIVKNSAVSKTDKTKLFSEVVLRQIAELHQWQGPLGWSPTGDAKIKQAPPLSSEASEDISHVVDVADNFLQELCCSSKFGIGFYDKTVGTSVRRQNQLLSHFVSWLGKHIEEPRKAALMSSILASSPDLVNGIITELQASLEPRWSDSWARRLDWLASLYSALPSIPPFLEDKERKISREQNIVTMATVFCIPPTKVSNILNQSLKHEDIQVRHRYLELVQVLVKKCCAIPKALASWSLGMGHVMADTEQLTENFTATVLKCLPSVSQLFACVDKIMALTTVATAAGKDGVAVIETKLGVGLKEHTSLLLQVLSLYQSLMPSLLVQRPKDISKLIQVVSGQLDMDNASHINSETQGVEDADLGGSDDPHGDKQTEGDEKNVLPQLYLLRLLSETDARTLSLTKEGMLEKLLLLAEHNHYMDLTVRLICKMLQSLEIFSDHGQELAIWLRNALEATKLSSSDGGKKDTLLTSPSVPAKGKSPKKQNQTESSTSDRSKDPAKDPHNVLLPFLARCISALVNNPTPYTDRVMEALSERPTGDDEAEEPMDTSSIGTNESVKEAILLMDDEELDELVAMSATKTSATTELDGETNPQATETGKNVDLPVSPLVLAALDQLNFNKEAGADVRDFVSHVVIDLLHSLVDPAPLTQVILRSGQSHHLSGNTDLYLKSLLPSLKQEPQQIQLEVSSCEKFTSLLLNVRGWEWNDSGVQSRKKFDKVEKQLDRELMLMTKSQRLTGLGQLSLYMGEILSSSSENSGREKFVHLYRVIAEKCLDLLMEEDMESARTTGDERVLDIVSALELEESETCLALKRMLLSPALLNALNSSKFYANTKAGVNKLKRPSLLSSESTVIEEVLQLFQNIFKKTVHLQWFQNETHLIEKHLGITTDLLTLVFEHMGKDKLKNEDYDGEMQIALCCYQILHLLFKTLDVKSLSTCLAKLFKLLPLITAGKSPSSSCNTASSTASSKLEELLVQMLVHWSEKMAAKLMPDGVEVLLNNCNYNSVLSVKKELYSSLTSLSPSKTSKTQSKEKDVAKKELDGEISLQPSGIASLKSSCKALELKVALTFEEVSGLSPEQFKPLFDTVFSQSSSEDLTSCVIQLLNKLPQQLVPVCARSIPDTALSSVTKLQACAGPEIAKLLIKSQKDIFQQVNSWLVRWTAKPPKRVTWWLIRAFLEAKDSFSGVDCQDSIKALKDCTQHFVKEALTSAGTDDNLVAVKLICSYLEDKTDSSYVETVFTSAAAVLTDRRRQASIELYEILLICAKTCPSVTLSESENKVKLEARVLQLALTHLDRLAAEKALDAEWEDYLLSLALKLVQTMKDADFNFLHSLWSSFVRNTLKNLYKNPKLMELLALLAVHVYNKTAAQTGLVNHKASEKTALSPCPRTLFSMCCSHTGFLAVMMSPELLQAKAGLVKLLFTLTEIEPACLDKQLRKVLVGAYSATLSMTDQYLLHMIERVSMDSEGNFECPLLWGKSVVDEQSVTEALGSSLHRETPVSDVLSQLNVRHLHQSMLNFPLRQTMKGDSTICAAELKSKPECYDPRFLLRVFAAILTPDKRVPLHQFVDKGCLGYLLTALSSHDKNCRLLAYQALNDLHLHAQGSRWSERVEVSFLLDLLNASRTQDGQKLSAVVALFFARVSRLFLYPADGLYMPIFRFLVARPEMDLRNVPEFYKLFFSPGSNYKQERNWSLSLLGEGLRETSDYWLYQKKSVFKIILSFYGSAISDKTSQALVLSVVKAACAEKSVAVHLVKEHGLLTWLSSAVDGLSSRGEHCDALCEIVHALWLSLSANTHQGSKTPTPCDGEDSGIESNEATEAQADGSDDSDSESDNDDTEKDDDVEGDDSSDEEDTATSQIGILKKRKMSVKEPGDSKRRKLDSSLQTAPGESVASKTQDTTIDPGSSSSEEDNADSTLASSSPKETVESAVKWKSNRRQQGKGSSQARIPKSTIAELGLLIKRLIWHFRKPSIRSVGKILEVYRGLLDLKLQSSNTQSESSAIQTSHSVTAFSTAEACIVLHRLGSASKIPVLVSAAESELIRLGVNVQSVLSQGIHSASSDGVDRGTVSDGQIVEDAVGLDDDITVEKETGNIEQSGEKEKMSLVSQWTAESQEPGEGGCDNLLEDEELARSLLMSCKEIFAKNHSIRFT